MDYTKGEWTIGKNGNDYIVFEPDTGTIAVIPDDLIQQKANAHLIAAAPLLYKALKALTFQFAAAIERPYSADTRVYTQANEALAKAEGKKSK